MTTVTKKSGKSHELAFQSIELLASAAHTEEANAVSDTIDLGDWDSMQIVLDITASATQAADTLDVYIDVSWDDGTTWYNAVHFTQQAGDGSAKKEWVSLSSGKQSSTPVDITSDASAGVVRGGLTGKCVRVRSTVVRDTGVDESHTFSVKVYIR